MSLTKDEIRFFETFGFLVCRQLLSPEELDEISRDFDAVMLEQRPGESFAEDRQQVGNVIQHRPIFQSMIEDGRFLGAVTQLIGPDCTLTGTDANLYVGDTDWHADHGWHPSWLGDGPRDPDFVKSRFCPGLKIALYLDPVTRDIGCLRVIPGSHRNPLHEALHSLHCDIGPGVLDKLGVQQFGIDPRDIPCYAIDSEPGDVLFFTHQLWHASFGGHTGRRMFALNFKSSG